MTRREKIRDAILGITDKMIESTSMCYRPGNIESGDTLEDKRRKQVAKWGSFRPDEIVVCAYETGMFGSVKKGTVFTEEALWEDGVFDVARKDQKYLNPLRYADIRDIRWSGKESSEFTIVLADAKVKVYASIYGKFYAEALKRAVAAAGYALEKKEPASKKNAKSSAQEAEKAAEPKKPADKKSPVETGKTAEKPSEVKEKPSPDAEDINARIAAIERELNTLYARRAELEAEEAAARKAAEEAAARKAAEEAAARKAAEEAAARKAAEEAAARKVAEEAAARKAAEEAAARKAAEEAAARKAAEEAAAAGEEEDDLFEEDEEVEIAQEAVLDGKIAKAIQRYEKAAAAGNATAMCELGSLYGDDIDMDRDAEKAFYWYDLADRHGDIMGAVFAAGLAIEIARTFEDLEIAEGWIARAEAKGQHKNAQNLKNKLLKKQREIERRVDAEAPAAEEAAARKAAEEAAARKAAEEAAAQNTPASEEDAALLMEVYAAKDIGRLREPAVLEAIRRVNEAARAYGQQKDYRKAKEKFRLTVQLGFKADFYNYALCCYRLGEYEEAYTWAKQALQNGNNKAEELRVNIIKKQHAQWFKDSEWGRLATETLVERLLQDDRMQHCDLNRVVILFDYLREETREAIAWEAYDRAIAKAKAIYASRTHFPPMVNTAAEFLAYIYRDLGNQAESERWLAQMDPKVREEFDEYCSWMAEFIVLRMMDAHSEEKISSAAALKRVFAFRKYEKLQGPIESISGHVYLDGKKWMDKKDFEKAIPYVETLYQYFIEPVRAKGNDEIRPAFYNALEACYIEIFKEMRTNNQTIRPVERKQGESDGAFYARLKVGDRFCFGKYPQNEKGEVEPIVWRVLDKQPGKMLVLSDKVIDRQPFNKKESGEETTWAASTLRAWLNNDFWKKAFAGADTARILETKLQTTTEPDYGWMAKNLPRDAWLPERNTEQCPDTVDRLFILSWEEVIGYLAEGQMPSLQSSRFVAGRRSVEDAVVWYNFASAKTAAEITPHAILGALMASTFRMQPYDTGKDGWARYGTGNWWLRNTGVGRKKLYIDAGENSEIDIAITHSSIDFEASKKDGKYDLNDMKYREMDCIKPKPGSICGSVDVAEWRGVRPAMWIGL